MGGVRWGVLLFLFVFVWGWGGGGRGLSSVCLFEGACVWGGGAGGEGVLGRRVLYIFCCCFLSGMGPGYLL